MRTLLAIVLALIVLGAEWVAESGARCRTWEDR
jgi:hypothetical protein